MGGAPTYTYPGQNTLPKEPDESGLGENISTGPSPVYRDQSGNLSTGFSPLEDTTPNLIEGNVDTGLGEGIINITPKNEGLVSGAVGVDTITPKDTTDGADGNGVIVGDGLEGKGDGTDIFDGVTWDDVKREMRNKTDLGRKFGEQIKILKDSEAIGGQDPILARLGISTINTGGKTADTASEEAAYNVIDGILGGSSDFKGNISNDAQITNYLKEQGYSDVEISAIKGARDVRLKEKRINAGMETDVEKEKNRLEERVAREKAEIEKQVQKTMNLSQRQAALRGVGISSLTENEMSEIQDRGNALMSAAQAKADSELAMYEAQMKGATGKELQSLYETYTNSVNALNEQSIANIDAYNKLLQQGKIESDMAFESLISNLSIAGVEGAGMVDKAATEVFGYAVDKYGKEIRDKDGNIVSFGGSKQGAEDVNSFVWGLKNGIVDGISQVPMEQRAQVLKAVSLSYDGKEGLSPKEELSASKLAIELFKTPKEDEINSIKALLQEGSTIEEISKMYKSLGVNEDYEKNFSSAMSMLSAGMQKSEFELYEQQLQRLQGKSDKDAAEYLLRVASEKGGSDEKSLRASRRVLVESYIELIKDLNVIYAADEDATGKGTQFSEWTANLFGQTNNPEINKLKGKVAASVQLYRKALSGAAFSKEEALEYESFFPGVGKSGELNMSSMMGVLDLFLKYDDNYYGGQLGRDNYKKLYPNGALQFTHPALADVLIKPESSDITGDSSDEDLLKYAQSQLGTTNQSSTNQSPTTITIKSTPEEKSTFLDEDFNVPDQTGQTKDLQGSIQSDIDRIAKNGSLVTGEKIVSSANKYGVNPAILAAFLRNDSSYGSAGLGVKNNNPGNVGQFDSLGTKAVEGYKTIEEGIDAAAENLNRRIQAFNSVTGGKRTPTAYELAIGKTKEGKKFFGVYMTDPNGPGRVQNIFEQLNS